MKPSPERRPNVNSPGSTVICCCPREARRANPTGFIGRKIKWKIISAGVMYSVAQVRDLIAMTATS